MSDVLRADVVVVGAGIMGSCAALHLARAGQDTILLDQFPVPHTRGSSHGQTRKIRQANFGHPALTPIMADAFTQWHQIQVQSGQSLLRPQPLLVVGSEGQRSQVEVMARSVKSQGHTPNWVTPTYINDTFKMKVPGSSVAFIDPSGGVLMADKSLNAIQSLFCGLGGRLVDEWPVKEVVVVEEKGGGGVVEKQCSGGCGVVEEKGGGGVVEVRGRKGIVKARSLVLCPGPWAGPFLANIGINIPLRVENVPLMYWRLKENATTTSFLDFSSPEGHIFAGKAEMEYPGMIKIQHHGGVASDPDCRDLGTDTELIRQRGRDYVKDRFPGLVPEPIVMGDCLYTVTPDEEFVIDRHPIHRNIAYACGFSGTGFKLAPVVGEELCRLVLGQEPRHDLNPFSAARFKNTSTTSKL